jgi:hypothetical protein
MKAKVMLLLAVIIMAAWSCQKEIDLSQKQKSTDLVVPGDFDWKTSQDLSVTVTGLPAQSNYISTLKIIDNDGYVYYTANYNLRENLALHLFVPVEVKDFILTYGSRTLRCTAQNGRLDFNFWQDDDKSDLGK